jgi:eukaryotic-like serine/threonine-protein kinase
MALPKLAMVGKMTNALSYAPGQKVHKYVLESLLGEGGMAVVFKGFDPVLRRHVALKLVRPGLARKQEFLDGIAREAIITSRLDHPNIVRVYDAAITDDGVFYIVMELLEDGQTLRNAMYYSDRRLEVAEGLAIAMAILDAVQVAHRTNVVHRDLKPENIFLMASGRVVVCDFGLAKRLADAGFQSSNDPFAGHGTVHYMAPEQIQAKKVGKPADVYAAGLILYEMLAGRYIFAQSTTDMPTKAEAKEQHRSATPVPLTEELPGFPPSLWALLDRMLAKDPAARPTAVEAFQQIQAETLKHRATHPVKAAVLTAALPDTEEEPPPSVSRASVAHVVSLSREKAAALARLTRTEPIETASMGAAPAPLVPGFSRVGPRGTFRMEIPVQRAAIPQAPAGVAQAPAGVAQAPAGVARAPAVVAQAAPSQAPAAVAQAPAQGAPKEAPVKHISGERETPTGAARRLDGAAARSSETAAPEPVAAAASPPLPHAAATAAGVMERSMHTPPPVSSPLRTPPPNVPPPSKRWGTWKPYEEPPRDRPKPRPAAGSRPSISTGASAEPTSVTVPADPPTTPKERLTPAPASQSTLVGVQQHTAQSGEGKGLAPGRVSGGTEALHAMEPRRHRKAITVALAVLVGLLGMLVIAVAVTRGRGARPQAIEAKADAPVPSGPVVAAAMTAAPEPMAAPASPAASTSASAKGAIAPAPRAGVRGIAPAKTPAKTAAPDPGGAAPLFDDDGTPARATAKPSAPANGLPYPGGTKPRPSDATPVPTSGRIAQ